MGGRVDTATRKILDDYSYLIRIFAQRLRDFDANMSPDTAIMLATKLADDAVNFQ